MAKKQKQTKKAKKRRIVEVIPGASDADGWQVVTYKRKAVSDAPREPASRAKKAKKLQEFKDGADFYKFQVKQKRLGEMRAELDAKRDHRKRGPRRKFNS